MRHNNMLAWPRNAGNPISEDQDFKNFLGEGASPQPGPRLKPPSLNSCIHSSYPNLIRGSLYIFVIHYNKYK